MRTKGSARNSPLGGKDPEYHAWFNMCDRCTNPKHKEWKHYGALGVSVCAEYLAGFRQPRGTARTGLERFIAKIGRRPSPLHSLDRICPFGNYDPDNIRWALITVQANNKRSSPQWAEYRAMLWLLIYSITLSQRTAAYAILVEQAA